ncbi:MAG TPA: DUF309 domain-containing protein [Bacteroidetes bacterium]|nr:DUF309 domain-containing protein [Bacteroidota bacterium]
MDEQFQRGIREFNGRRFFEAHDILEDLWHGYRGDDRRFLQGLIQVAVGYYHFENRNLKGARSQLTKACAKIESYGPEHRGIRLLEFLRCIHQCLDALERVERGEEVRLEHVAIPTIILSNQLSDSLGH